MHSKCTDAPGPMTQTLILKGKPDFFKRYPVYIRWSDGQKRTFKKTSLVLTKEQFNSFKKGEPGKDKELYRRYLSAMDETILRERDKIGRHRPKLLLTDIDVDFLRKYKEHLYEIGNSPNTVYKAFKFIKTIVRKALREKLLADDPFQVFKTPLYRNPQRNFLKKEEVEKIEGVLSKPVPEELKSAATWFLIGCETGLRYSDMCQYDKEKHLVNGRLVLYTAKTSELVSIPLREKVKGYFELVGHQPLSLCNQYYNRLLKQVQKVAEVKTLLTAHVSRHTAAVIWADAGISMEVVAKLLGHTSIKSTAIYFKITGGRIDEEFKKLG